MLTPAQCTTLKALAMADQTAAALIDAGNDIALADWFNTPTANYIWRSSVPVDEVFDALDGGLLFQGEYRVWHLRVTDVRHFTDRGEALAHNPR